MFVGKSAEVAAGGQAGIPPPVLARAFDALFLRGLGGEPTLLEALRGCGYDADHPEPSYASSVWRDCLEAARRHLYAGVPAEEGFRALGRKYASGFAATPVGEVHKGIAYGVRAYVAKLPQLLRLGRRDLEIQLRFETDQRCVVTVRGPDANGAFMAGVVEARIRACPVPMEIEVVVTHADPCGFDLIIRW